MVEVTYSETSGDLIHTVDGEQVVYNLGDLTFIMVCTALVMIMTPGIAFFYSGILRRKNALSMIWMALAIYCVISIAWFFWGYSLTFSSGNAFIGDLSNFGLINVLDAPSGRMPELLFAVYQMVFATLTPVIAFGATAERGRLGPLLVLSFCWHTIVYCPITHWTWSGNAWLATLGDLDFAGGGPVHMSSGFAALAYSLWLGKRRGYGTERLAYRPSSVANVFIGTTLIFFGWFGFNGGSALGANLRAVQAMMATNIAAAGGGLTWMLLDYRLEKKWSTIGMCSGVVAGLVGITPAAGYVGTPSSLAIGVLTAVACNFATKLKFLLKIDETLDVWALHGIGGFTGSILTGIFADSRVASFDGLIEIDGGWINQNYVQIGYQLASSVTVSSYSFVMTLILCIIIDYIPGMGLRCSEEDEIVGIDASFLGEETYDYVHFRREADGQYNHGGHASAYNSSDKVDKVTEKPVGSSGSESSMA